MAVINIKGVIGQDYTFKQFITDYANAGSEMISLTIDSVGGYVEDGEKIANFILEHQDKFISVINTGDVASIAASIFLSLPFEKRFFDVRKGVALIHNPFLGDSKGLNTTAIGLKMLSEEMLNEEKKIKSFITKQTNADNDVVSALMAINEPLNEEQLRSINFANIIKFQAVAILKNNNDMDKEQGNKILAFLDKIDAKLFGKKTVAIMLTDATGNEVDFPELVEGDVPKVGDKTTAGDGEIVMADGSTLVVAGGVITEIKPAEIETPSIEIEALKAELEALKTENSALKGVQAKLIDVEKDVVELRSKIKSQMLENEPIEKPVGKPTEVKNRFETNK